MSDSNYSKLSDFLSRAELPSAPESFTETTIFRHWKKAAGQNIADNTAKLQIEGNSLSVTINSPTWAHALINSQTTILSKMNQCGFEDLEEIVIRVAVEGKRNTSHRKKAVTEEPQAQLLPARLSQVFVEIAKNASNPETKETFLRLSRISEENKRSGH